MLQIGKFLIANTSPSAKYEGGVRVYVTGTLIGSVSPSTKNPLGYCRRHPQSRYRHALVALLKDNGATQEEIDFVLHEGAFKELSDTIAKYEEK